MNTRQLKPAAAWIKKGKPLLIGLIFLCLLAACAKEEEKTIQEYPLCTGIWNGADYIDSKKEISLSFPDHYARYTSSRPNLGNDDKPYYSLLFTESNAQKCFTMDDSQSDDFIVMEIVPSKEIQSDSMAEAEKDQALIIWLQENYKFLGYIFQETFSVSICGHDYAAVLGQSGMSDFYQLDCFREMNGYFIHFRITGESKESCLNHLTEIQ